LKTQVIIERNSRQIIDVQEAKGGEHDFKVYKETIGKGISNSIPLDADSGYQGIEEYHSNSFIPIKASKNHCLTGKEKAYNRRLAGRRVVIEHINTKIKTFKCMTYPYRRRCCNRHSLRMTLICGLINYDRQVQMVVKQVQYSSKPESV
jgi:ribosomal protein L35